MIPVGEARATVLERTPDLGIETVGLGAACGRALRETIRADRDQPPFDRSLVDGYAVRAADLGDAGPPLRLVGTVPAGRAADFAIGAGEAAAIMTGAPMPKGADAVILVEHADADGDAVSWPTPRFASLPPVAPGDQVARRGRDARSGSPLLLPGTRLSPAGIGVLATVGRTRVQVGRRPRIAVLSTGDELAHPRKRRLRAGAIRDANSHMLAARCRALGLRVRRLGFVRDQPDALFRAIREGLRADVLLVSGGVSMGRFDLVEDVLTELGAALHITSVAIRPGKPFVFATIDAPGTPRLIFGLPGNPVSALTTLEVLVRPALDRAEGMADPTRPRMRVRLEAPVSNPGPRQAFLPVRVHCDENGALAARPIPIRGSGDIAAISLANGLLTLPGTESASAGASALVEPLPGCPDPGAAAWSDPRPGSPPC